MIELIEKIIIIYALASCIISCLYIALDPEVKEFYDTEIKDHALFHIFPKWVIDIIIFLVGIFVWPKWLYKDIRAKFKKK